MSVKSEKTERRERLRTIKELLLSDEVELTLSEVWVYLYHYAAMELALLRVQRSGRQVSKHTTQLHHRMEIINLRRDLRKL